MTLLENMSVRTKRRIVTGTGLAVLLGVAALAIAVSPRSTNGAGNGAGAGVVTKVGKIPALAANWTTEWPRTDFSRHSIDLKEIRSGGPPKDGIPPIDKPKFVAISEVRGVKGT